MSLQPRQSAEKIITEYKSRAGLPLETLLKYAGISQSTWHEWMLRRSIQTKHNNNITKNYFLTPQKIEAIVLFCKGNQLKGYRMLRHEMIDKNIGFVSCSSVYNIIKRYNLGKEWGRKR